MLRLGILLIDDDPALLAATKDYLERADYWVLTAKTTDEALRLCLDEVIHLAVIDIRLKDNTDENDFSGLQLAADLPPHICRIILTAGPHQHSEDLVRDTLEPDDQGKGLVDKFLWKKEGHKKVLATIQWAFRAKIKINPDLVTKKFPWRALVEQIKAFRNLDNAGKLKAEQVLLDLTCRLFHEKSEVQFRESTLGHGQCTVALVHPTDPGGEELDLAVKIGPHKSIDQEEKNYGKYVKAKIQNPATLQLGPVWSREMGAIAYSFIGDQGKSVRTFNKYYIDDRVSSQKIKRTLKYLLKGCCANWYAGKRKPEGAEQKPLDLWYRDSLHLLDEAHVAALKDHLDLLLKQKTAGDFSFNLLNDDSLQVQIAERPQLSLPNPLRFALEEHSSAAGDDSFKPPAFVAITHGDLHSGNIIVGEKGTAWLIDFFKTGWGPVLRDFAELESDIKFTLLQSHHLLERYELEQRLLAPHSLKDSFVKLLKNPTPAQARAIKIIQYLRKLAYQLTGIGNMHEYQVALLFFALKRMIGFTSADSPKSCEEVAQYHALLSAAMICERLQTEDRKANLPAEAKQKIFLSYAGEDRDKVDGLYQQLSDAGHAPWIDHKDIVGGEDWNRSIKLAIQSSAIFIACLSRNSVGKRGFIQREVNQALDIAQEMLPHDIYIIPLMLEDCELPERLSKYQAVRFYQPDGWTRLLQAIEKSKKYREQK